MAAKKKASKVAAERKRMSQKEVDQFIERFAKRHSLKGKALDDRLRHVAATRLAALERYAKAQA